MADKRRPEILSPAGNPEKLLYAVNYGADAVYCALDRFGLRSYAGNFTPEEFRKGVEFAHSRGVKVYCVMNAMPVNGDLAAVREYASNAVKSGADAFIVSDPGVMEIIKELDGNAVIHLSTQASTLNSASVRFWAKAGVKRIVLGRELLVSEIKELRDSIPPEVEIECFVHGAMCMAYSGRCLLSNYFTGRDANAGQCAQPCRWKYHLREDKNGYTAVAEEDGTGSYVYSSKDMNMIEHVPELIAAGIDAYYTAAVTNAYRIALEGCMAGRPFDPRCYAETESVSHREYGTGFYYERPSENANTVKVNEYLASTSFLCTVEEYDASKGLAKCVQRNKMRVGDRVNLLSPGGFGKDITLTALYDSEMTPIDSTPHAGMVFYAELPEAKPFDIIRGR